MKIGIIGLGLIGGSLARAFHARTGHRVYGTDQTESVVLAARMVGALRALAEKKNIALKLRRK